MTSRQTVITVTLLFTLKVDDIPSNSHHSYPTLHSKVWWHPVKQSSQLPCPSQYSLMTSRQTVITVTILFTVQFDDIPSNSHHSYPTLHSKAWWHPVKQSSQLPYSSQYSLMTSRQTVITEINEKIKRWGASSQKLLLGSCTNRVFVRAVTWS